MKLHPKTPLSLVLGILINIVLVVLAELLLFYRIPMPPAGEILADMDSRYENCRVICDVNLDNNRGVRFYMVKTAAGETDLVPVRQHSFFPSRTRLLRGKILRDLNLAENTTKQVMVAPNLFAIFISDGTVRVGSAAGGSFMQTAMAKYLGLGAVLAFLELWLWSKLRGE